MHRKLLHIVVLLLSLLSVTAGAEESPFYFGVWLQADCGLRDHYGHDPAGFISLLRRTFKCNLVEAALSQHFKMMADSGLTLIARPQGPTAVRDSVYPLMYANYSCYVIWEANPDSLGFYAGRHSQWGLKYRGQPVLDGAWQRFQVGVSQADENLPEQYGPQVGQTAAYLEAPWGTPAAPGWLNYTSRWVIELGPQIDSLGDSIATFAVTTEIEPGQRRTISQLTLLNSDYPSRGARVDTIDIPYSYRDCGFPLRAMPTVSYLLDWHGNRDLSIARVIVHDDRGYELVHHTDACADSISWYVNEKLGDAAKSILFFGTRDDLTTANAADQFIPMQLVNQILTSRSLPGLLSAHSWNYKFAETIGLPGFTIYPFPFLWAYPNWTYRNYVHAFSDTADSTLPPDHHTLQDAWDVYTRFLSEYKDYAERTDRIWIATLQSFNGHYAVPNSHRYPTKQEFLCQFFLTLSYAPDGITHWKYFPHSRNDSTFLNRHDRYAPAQIYITARDYLAPLTENILPLLASLEWRGSWKWGEVVSDEHCLDRVTCDLLPGAPLFLQIGHFVGDDPDSDYYLLVNRRCLPNETIAGTVFFDPFADSSSVASSCRVTELIAGNDLVYNVKDNLLAVSYSIPPGEARLYHIEVLR